MAKCKAINEQDRCVACGVCVKVCPKDAISIYKGCYAQIDEEKCIGCGFCEKNCPAGVIHKVFMIMMSMTRPCDIPVIL